MKCYLCHKEITYTLYNALIEEHGQIYNTLEYINGAKPDRDFDINERKTKKETLGCPNCGKNLIKKYYVNKETT